MKTIMFGSLIAVSLSGLAWAQQSQPQGNITRAAAIAEAEQRFARLDVDRNGALDESEQQIARAEMMAQRRRQMDARLANMSPAERAKLEERRKQWGGPNGTRPDRAGPRGGPGRQNFPTTLAEFREQAVKRFDRIDLNRDGVITVEEQQQLRTRRPNRD